jgi:hypothetical protein
VAGNNSYYNYLSYSEGNAIMDNWIYCRNIFSANLGVGIKKKLNNRVEVVVNYNLELGLKEIENKKPIMFTYLDGSQVGTTRLHSPFINNNSDFRRYRPFERPATNLIANSITLNILYKLKN